ncbi:TPA: hypothetical protein ACXJEZ_002607 [Providencia rettgeri]
MYSTGTVTTTANSTKLVGTGTKWLNNINRVSAEQAIQIQIDNTVYNNSIHSIQSDTELTLNFPLPTAATGGKYVILTTMVHSASDAMNKIVAMQVANVQFSDILTRWMTEQGIITVTLPDQTTQQLRTTKEMDKQLDGKLDKTGGVIRGNSDALKLQNTIENGAIYLRFERKDGQARGWVGAGGAGNDISLANVITGKTLTLTSTGSITYGGKDLIQVGEYGLGIKGSPPFLPTVEDFTNSAIGIYTASDSGTAGLKQLLPSGAFHGSLVLTRYNAGNSNCTALLLKNYGTDWLQMVRRGAAGSELESCLVWHNRNTTKDSNGNLKAASPVVKLFADNIELNEESEGVEMEHLGIGHYLIKGVVGFNADGAWGINNGFVIPQDHNGKNMVLIDYEVRPDGDIEVFVFHQQNADMPKRFQNKRIKHFDEEGVPVYFENYEPCDVPESRWIDMRVEMPPNSLYNQKQVEAERLAKLEAERLAQEEAKRAAEEAERAEQEAAERKQYGLDDNSVLL